ncbi:Microsomal glutathione S-transferase 3 [Apophysomyces sp. BC1034]|nr:Microsomal glutathione S-transferase 3 [Apophysomyces sp. BC1015]KAG0178575.1 Microsomal glutathione S-transferase 3 [Apophysomyces sp. BC1021]KAG0194747.1 Microsomal glutathione S-transferase 3 [Apophysomyces sp. BC1034]
MSGIVIPREYGYVLGAASVTAFYVFTLGFKVGSARKAAGIPYPYAYAEKAEAEKDPRKHIFNCAQRAHQNTLEQLPLLTTLLLVGGIRHPEISAGAAAIWVLGRIVYVKNYVSGEVGKRVRGSFGYIGLLTLLGTTVSTIYHILA